MTLHSVWSRAGAPRTIERTRLLQQNGRYRGRSEVPRTAAEGHPHCRAVPGIQLGVSARLSVAPAVPRAVQRSPVPAALAGDGSGPPPWGGMDTRAAVPTRCNVHVCCVGLQRVRCERCARERVP